MDKAQLMLTWSVLRSLTASRCHYWLPQSCLVLTGPSRQRKLPAVRKEVAWQVQQMPGYWSDYTFIRWFGNPRLVTFLELTFTRRSEVVPYDHLVDIILDIGLRYTHKKRTRNSPDYARHTRHVCTGFHDKNVSPGRYPKVHRVFLHYKYDHWIYYRVFKNCTMFS